jgi:phosphoserine phosphatase RsbX
VPELRSQTDSLLEHAVRATTLEGEVESGDAHVVKTISRGLLLGAIDGLGHGPEAAFAARRAVEVIDDLEEKDPAAIIHECHRALRSTRGVVMTLAAIDSVAATIRWVGVGNVDARLLHLREEGIRSSDSPPLIGGVVGYKLPRLRPTTVPVHRGDLLLLATDGVRQSFADDLVTTQSCAAMAEEIMRVHGRRSDDALVLVGRYLGRPRK